MQSVVSSYTHKIRYLRIPHWVRMEFRCFHAVDPFFDVHIKGKEHRVKGGNLSVRGIFFESGAYLPFSTFISVRIILSEDSSPFEFDCRVVESRKMEEDHRYRVTADFVARTGEDTLEITSFAKKYF